MARPQDAVASRSFEEIEPFCKWSRGQDSDFLEVHLPEGVKAKHLSVQVHEIGTLRITGECPLDGNKGIKIQKDIKIPEDCKKSEIRAKFSKGILHISMPKSDAEGVEVLKRKTLVEACKGLEEGLEKQNSMAATVVVAVAVAVAAFWVYKAYRVGSKR